MKRILAFSLIVLHFSFLLAAGMGGMQPGGNMQPGGGNQPNQPGSGGNQPNQPGGGGIGNAGTFVYDSFLTSSSASNGAIVYGDLWTGYDPTAISITVPSNVATVVSGVCAGNTRITLVDLSGTKVRTLPTAAFRGCTGLVSLKLPTTCTDAGTDVFGDFTGTVYYPESLTNTWTAILAAAGVKGCTYTSGTGESAPLAGDDPSGNEDPSTGGDDVPDGTFMASAATEFDGYLTDDSTNLVGTITIKAAKAVTVRKTGVTRSRITVALLPAGGKRIAASGYLDLSLGTWTTTVKDGRGLALSFSKDSVTGTFGDWSIMARVNGFVSRTVSEKTAANEQLGPWLGQYALAYDDADGLGLLSVKVAAKGKVKVSGTTGGGLKVSASAQLIQGEDWSYVPVVYAKKATLVFGLWLKNDGSEARVEGLANALFGLPGSLASGATLYLDGESACTLNVNGTVWSSTGETPAKLKLRYTARTGVFKGTYKLSYAVGTRVRTVSVTVQGLLVGDRGYGRATCKALSSSATVYIE